MLPCERGFFSKEGSGAGFMLAPEYRLRSDFVSSAAFTTESYLSVDPAWAMRLLGVGRTACWVFLLVVLIGSSFVF